jgi:hypothetical protein
MYDIIKNTKIKDIMSKRLDILLQEYDVKNEDELAKKLYDDAQTLPCIKCGRETEYDNLLFIDSNPICKNCVGE